MDQVTQLQQEQIDFIKQKTNEKDNDKIYLKLQIYEWDVDSTLKHFHQDSYCHFHAFNHLAYKDDYHLHEKCHCNCDSVSNSDPETDGFEDNHSNTPQYIKDIINYVILLAKDDYTNINASIVERVRSFYIYSMHFLNYVLLWILMHYVQPLNFENYVILIIHDILI